MKQSRLNLGSFHRHHGDNNSNNSEQQSTSKQNDNPSPTDHHQEEDDYNLNPNRKQSVITKVKEKAIKWRQTLAKKKHTSHEDDDPDCLEAQIYNQEEVPSPSRIPALGEGDIKNPRSMRTSTNVHRREQFPDHNTKTLAEAVTERLGPTNDGAIYELSTKNRNLSSVQEMSVSKPLTVTPNTSEDDTNVVEEDVAFGVYEEGGLDKGVSVIDYFKNKIEPGEDERALLEVISKAVRSEMNVCDKGVLEKVREVVTSLIEAEQEKEDEEERKQQQTSKSPLIPISTNAYEGDEENQERILQAN